MTSLKKPFIAIASAVALAATAILAVPANAATTALTVAGSAPATTGTSSATAIALPVPADNSVDSADVLRIALSGLTAGSNVVVSATNAKVVTSITSGSATVKADAGTASATIPTGTGTTADVYVYTTTTLTGSVSVTADNATTVYYVKGNAGAAYNLAVAAPNVANLGAAVEVTATVTDVFGNAVTNATISSTVIRGTLGSFSYDATDKRYEATLTAPATAGSTVIANTITASAVAGLAKPVTEIISTVAVADLAGQVAALDAKVADLEAKLAAAEAKAVDNRKKYNGLAKQWNKKFPRAKVKLISSK
jgi:hypothetical protein